MTISRSLQWIGATLVLLVLVGLNYDFDSEAGMRMNASLDDPLSQGLRGYWKLDEGTGTSTTADASGNANTLSMTGPPTWTTGTIGPYAMDFSGSGQYLSVASPASGVLDFVDGADFTLTGWFNRDLFAADHTIVAKKTDQTTNAGYVIWIDNNGGTDYLNFEISDGTDTYSVASATDFSATGWHNFAAVWDDSNGMYLYIDGGLNGSTTTSTSSIGSLANANAFRVGAESDAGVPFDGKLDDIRVYGSALSAGEVAKLYQTTAPTQPVDTGLVGHWTFDGPDIAGTTALDRSSFGNNGTITGAVPAKGKLGQGMSFDGTGDYASALALNVTNFSISLWVKSAVVPGTSSISSLVKNRDRQFEIRWDSSAGNETTFGITSPVGVYYGVSIGGISANTWYHLVGTWDGTTMNAYNNGTLSGSLIPGTSPDTSGANVFEIGRNDNFGGYVNATLDDIRVYNRALSVAEVNALYGAGR